MKQTQEDKIISEFLKSLGPWREFVVIGGGFSLFIYKLYLADPKLENLPVGTRDIDSLIPRKVPEISKKNIAKYLNEAGFTHVFKDVDIPATASFLKEIDGVEVEIEFLTDSATRDDKNKNVMIAGIVAQPLSYLTLSLQTTMEFQTYSEEAGRVVSPGAWIFHKGLTFTRRKSPSKMLKDLYGIWYVATQLGDFSDQALNEFGFLSEQYPKWLQTFQKQLSHWVEQASPAEWSKLEAQDPSGKLKKLGFARIVKKLLTCYANTEKLL
ncbi:MAG TPA: GSU2403 family nucleotidyltransferase fold protein [Chlamydiales bacterium]|nr:GSU2403 family nucleotidyltransferase fold protein [Chlamydiales bacterium]